MVQGSNWWHLVVLGGTSGDPNSRDDIASISSSQIYPRGDLGGTDRQRSEHKYPQYY